MSNHAVYFNRHCFLHVGFGLFDRGIILFYCGYQLLQNCCALFYPVSCNDLCVFFWSRNCFTTCLYI